MSAKPKLIFVVGIWRSGTSLLHAMLNHHPQIALMFEAEPFGLFPLKKNYILPDDWPMRLDFFNQTITRHKINPALLPTNASGRDCLLALFETWALRKNALVMGGKSPTYHAWLPQISEIFPEAEFIIIWRNPLDSCRSAAQAGKKNRFFSSPGITQRMLFGSETMFHGVVKLRAAGRRVHELTMDALLANPETELRGICNFIGIEFNSVMLDLQSADHSMLPPGEHHQAVRSKALQKKASSAEVLPPEFIAKGNRYMNLWRRRYAGTIFARVLPENSNGKFPGALEQTVDGVNYWWWRTRARVKTKLIRRMPLPLWKQFKKLRNRPAPQLLPEPVSEKMPDTSKSPAEMTH